MEEVVCCYMGVIGSALNSQTFWTAVGAIGTVCTALYAVLGTHRAQEQANPQNWLRIDDLYIVRTEDGPALYMEAFNQGFSDISIISVEVLFYPDETEKNKIKNYLSIFGKKSWMFLLMFGSYTDTTDVIQRYTRRYLCVRSFKRNDGIIDLNGFNEPARLHENLIKYKTARNKEIKVFINTNVAVFEYEMPSDKIQDSIYNLIQAMNDRLDSNGQN